MADGGGNPVTWEEPKPKIQPEPHPITSCDVEQFCETSKIFQSPNVTLLAGLEKVSFNLPKGLLTKFSPFFDRAFNVGFEEGLDNTMNLEEDLVTTVKMTIQWMYISSITLAATSDSITSERLTMYLEFFKLADKIDLQRPLTQTTQQMRSKVRTLRQGLVLSPCEKLPECEYGYSSWRTYSDARPCSNLKGHDFEPLRDNVILAEHIRTVSELSPGHEITKLLVEACVVSYLLSFPENGRRTFKFKEELRSIEGFAEELLEAVAHTVSTTTVHGDYTAHLCDPLTESFLSL